MAIKSTFWMTAAEADAECRRNEESREKIRTAGTEKRKMKEIRAVVNQCGVAMELHGHTDSPVTLNLIGWPELDAYRKLLTESNPDMRHAAIGQLAVMYANRIYQNVNVSQVAWTYNASEDRYSRA